MIEWNKAKLGEIASITSSKRIYANEYKTEGIPFYRGKEIIEKYYGHEVSTELFISRERYEEIKHKFDVPRQGDILLTSVGTLGIPWFVDEEEFYFKDGNLTWIRCNEEIVSDFLYLWLNSPEAKKQINSMCIGSTQKALTIEIIKKFDVSLPPLDVQKAICSMVNPISDKINVNNAINRNLQEQALTIYHKMFVETRNDERTICRTDKFFDITIGKTPPRKEKEWFSENPKDCVWISISDMGSCGIFVTDSSEYLTQAAVDKHNVKVVPDNTVILSFKLTVGRIAITVGEATTNEAIAHFNTNKENIVEYLYCYLKSFDFDSLGSTSSIGTAVNSKTIKAMEFVVPGEDELQEFCDIVRPMFEQIKKNQFANQNLVSMRDGLIPKLMSGELDVSGLEI